MKIETAIDILQKMKDDALYDRYGQQYEDVDNALLMAIQELKMRLPKPLTKEELIDMAGQPVWTVGVSYGEDCWDIIERVDDNGITFGCSTEGAEWWAYDLRQSDGVLYGCGWCCYRNQPQPEED